MLYMYKILNIFDPLPDYFNQEIVYYISEKYKIKFQSNIGLIYGRDHFYYYVK
jgi:hypothetical protein